VTADTTAPSVKRYALTSYCAGWHWPTSGSVEWSDVTNGIPDTSQIQIHTLPCLHTRSLHWQSHANWVVLEIEPSDYEESDGFVRFRKARILFNGPPQKGHAFLTSRNMPAPNSLPAVTIGRDWENVALGKHDYAIAGWDGNASVGEYGVAYTSNGLASAGDYGVAISVFGEVKAANLGCAWTRYGRVAIAGGRGVAWTEEFGRSEAGGGGVAITDDCGRATSGDFGVAVAGCRGEAKAGNCGVAFAKDDGMASAGDAGVLLIRWQSEIKVARVGEGGIKPNTMYRLDDDGKFVECESENDAED
jgi:hypothetical protein